MGDYEKFKEKVYQLTKIDLSSYKERQMKRRIDSLITKNKIKSYDEYIEAICNQIVKEREKIAVLTIALSPECCNGWDNSIRVYNYIAERLSLEMRL